MRIWLDDLCDDPESPDRWTPKGWTPAKTALQACRLIRRNSVRQISFDYDLGGPEYGTGVLVARFIERLACAGRLRPIQWSTHTKHPTGEREITTIMRRAEQHWSMASAVRCA